MGISQMGAYIFTIVQQNIHVFTEGRWGSFILLHVSLTRTNINHDGFVNTIIGNANSHESTVSLDFLKEKSAFFNRSRRATVHFVS